MKILLTILALCFPALAFGQYTSVSALLQDVNGTKYQNCSFNAIFVGESSNPGPYLISGSTFQKSIDGIRCDSFGNLSLRIASNSAVSPSPSQWQFNFCDQTGKYCGQTLITISGSSQDVSSQLTAAAPILPINASGYNRVQDEGVNIAQRSILNFIGPLISCADNSGASSTDCTILSAYTTIRDEGTPLTQRSVINFTGAGVTCSDSGGITGCDIPGGISQAYTTIQDEGTPLTQRSTANFTGAGITCSDSGGVTTCNVPGGGISGLTSGIFPIATGATTIGNSKLSDVSSLGIKYDLGSPGFWQLTTNNITWHPANLNDIILEATSTNAGFNLGGFKIKGASTTGSACGGHIQLIPGDSNSAGNNSTITADGGCSNGVGAIGASITLTAGSTAVNNGGGDINLNPGTGVFSNGSVKVTQSLTISGGTPIKKILSATASLDFGNLAAIGCEDLTITVTGAALGDTVSIGVPNGSVPGSTAQFSGWVSSANTVTVRYCDLIGGDPASGTFRATVTQF